MELSPSSFVASRVRVIWGEELQLQEWKRGSSYGRALHRGGSPSRLVQPRT